MTWPFSWTIYFRIVFDFRYWAFCFATPRFITGALNIFYTKNLFFKIPGQFWRSSVKVEVLTERLKRPKVDGNAQKAHIEYPLVHKHLSLSALQAEFNQKNWADITLFSVHSRLSWLKFSHWTDLTLLKCPCYYRTVFHVIHMCTLHTVYTNTFCIPERAYE